MATILKHTTLFWSWLRTIIAFRIFGKFKNFTPEQLMFFQDHFKPQTERDRRLKIEIVKHNSLRIWRQS